MVELAASLIVFTVFDNQLTVELLVLIERILLTELVSESLGIDDDVCRSWWINSWFSHNACVRANFFSANSISTWRKRSAIDDETGGKSSSIISRSGVETTLDGGEIVSVIKILQESQQAF